MTLAQAADHIYTQANMQQSNEAISTAMAELLPKQNYADILAENMEYTKNQIKRHLLKNPVLPVDYRVDDLVYTIGQFGKAILQGIAIPDSQGSIHFPKE